MDKWRFINFKVADGPSDNQKELIAEYEQETDTEIIRHFMRSQVFFRDYPTIEFSLCDSPIREDTVDFGFGELSLQSHIHVLKKTKMKEMTLEEIEKALGHKIKIVKEH